MEKHLESHKKISRIYRCDVCRVLLIEKSAFDEHIRKCFQRADLIPNDCDWYKCSMCESLFKTLLKLEIHLIVQHGIKGIWQN